jgi:hypothetical protein
MAKKASKPNQGVYTEVGNFKRFIPLHSGMCYIRDNRDGRNHHVKVNSEKFNTLVDEIIQSAGRDRVIFDLELLAKTYPNSEWSEAYKRYK